MLRALKYLSVTVLAASLWVLLVVTATLQGWFHSSLAPAGDSDAFVQAATGMLGAQNRGNAAMGILQGGERLAESYISIGAPVDGDTLFQVASLGKWITAWGVMSLVQSGQLDLDAPVETYLQRWSLPPSEFDNSQVTARRLLSHTAGLVDGLGYAGFLPGEPVQTLEASLTQAADVTSGRGGRTEVGLAPGSKWLYSGGGYTLLQLLIEEISGESFEDYMQHAVFKPLGMNRSTFEPDLERVENMAVFYDEDGSEAIHYRFTALAAASLYTSVNDLVKLLQAHLPGPAGEPIGRGVLSAQTLELMREAHATQYGADIWGLGTMLYAQDSAGNWIIGHDGNNDPAINTAARVNPETGDGIVVLETGAPLLATRLAGEWVFWLTGVPDLLMVTMATSDMMRQVFAGWLVIALLAFVIWFVRRRRTGAAGG
jgi:CubicO group peptidase (beta-lactamase class C family)